MWAALGKAAVGMAKGASKKAASGAKKKGAEMAKNIVNKKEKDNSSAIVVREKSASIVQSPGGDLVKQDQDSSIVKPKSGSSPLDRIDSALLDIINTLKSRRKLMLAQSRRDRVQSDKIKKGKREGLLEKMKAGGKKMLGNVKAAATGWWERLQRFLLMTMLGALVVAIKENWEAIKAQIDKVVNIVKGIWEFTSPVLIPLFKALKWITIQGFKMMAGIVTTDKKKIEKGTDEASNELENLKKETEGVTKQFKESEKNVKNISNTKEPKLDTKKDETKLSESEVADGVTTDNLGRKTKTDDEGVKLMKGSSGEWKKADDRPLSETNPGIKKNTGGRKNRKKYNVGGYVNRDGEVHEGEYVVKESVVKKVGVPNIEDAIKTMMKTSTANIKQNPLKIMSVMQGLSKDFAPMGGQLPGIINEKIMESKFGNVSTKIMEKMEKTSSILNDQEIVEKTFSNNTIAEGMKNVINTINEQTDYENPSSNTIIVPLPSPPQPSSGGGSEGETKVITIQKDSLNRYVETLIQGALY
jgi:hypothetical protein